jgi:hypothetical protein
MWAMLIVGVSGTGNVLAKNVPASSYDAESNFSGFVAKGHSFASRNGGALSIDAESAAGFSRTAHKGVLENGASLH